MPAPQIAPLLTLIANASVKLGYFPDQWRCFTTVALRKPAKPDYSAPKAFRPIALEETLGKVVEGAMATRLTAMSESHGLLPRTHYGGRPGRNTTDALLHLTQHIKNGWRRRKVVSALLLDISQAFPTVSHERLLHNMRKRRVPEEVVAWTRSFLSNRRTTLIFDDYQSPPLNASNGVPQGSPLSPILYLFYSSDLLDIIDPKDKYQLSIGYIDDTALVVESESVAINIQLLTALVERALNWERTHACRFDVAKFQLCHFTRNDDRYEPLPLIIGSHVIQPSETVKYLGLILDRKLRWKQQVEKALAKGTSALLAVSRLARSTFGLQQKYARQLFISVVVPRMEYGLAVFYEPVRMQDNGRRRGSVGVARRFGQVQRLAARLITGAFKTTSGEVLDIHAGLLPVDLRMNRSVFNAAARLACVPKQHPLHAVVQRCTRNYPRSHRSAVHEMFKAFPSLRDTETVDPALYNPSWKSRCTFSIALSKAQAIKDVKTYEATSFCVYSDGSGIDEGIGSAAVALPHQRGLPAGHVSRLRLGTTQNQIVFGAEVVGTVLALGIIRRATRIQSATILLDNQPAISSLRDYRPKPGQYLTSCFNQEVERLLKAKPHLSIHVAWVPGHQDVEGNERADEEAKRAARGESSASAELPRSLAKLTPTFPASIAGLKASAHKETVQQWRLRWSTSSRGQRFHSTIDRSPPRLHITSAILDLPCHQASILTQLRTGHVALNKYLHRIGAVNSALCTRCHIPETPRHFLLECHRYEHERHKLRLRVGRLSVPKLLGSKKHRKAVLHYILSTERFPPYSRLDD